MRRRFGLALFCSCLAVALVVTLWPFRFSLATASFARIDWRLYYRSRTGHVIVDRDLLQNLVMLSPLGAGWALLRGPRGVGRIALEAAVLGVGIAAVIETLQIFAPTRFSQLADVWRNAAGCVAGAVLVAWFVPHMPRFIPGTRVIAATASSADVTLESQERRTGRLASRHPCG